MSRGARNILFCRAGRIEKQGSGISGQGSGISTRQMAARRGALHRVVGRLDGSKPRQMAVRVVAIL
jgi:hypothetical protein